MLTLCKHFSEHSTINSGPVAKFIEHIACVCILHIIALTWFLLWVLANPGWGVQPLAVHYPAWIQQNYLMLAEGGEPHRKGLWILTLTASLLLRCTAHYQISKEKSSWAPSQDIENIGIKSSRICTVRLVKSKTYESRPELHQIVVRVKKTNPTYIHQSAQHLTKWRCSLVQGDILQVFRCRYLKSNTPQLLLLSQGPEFACNLSAHMVILNTCAV